MKIVAAIVLTFLTQQAAAVAADPPPAEDAVKTAIEKFDPLWRPPAGALRGWVVGIEPAIVGTDADSLRCNDLNLITAHHLRHFITFAGGKAVMTRADDTRLAAGSSLDDRAFEIIRDAGCRVCVSIRCNPTSVTSIEGAAGDGAAENAAFVEEMRRQLGHSSDERQTCKSELLRKLASDQATAGVLTCEIALPGPAPINVETRKNCRAVARAIYDAVAAVAAKTSAAANIPFPGREGTGEGKSTARLQREGETSAEPDTDVVAAAEPRSRTQIVRAADLARKIWPAGDLPLDRTDWFCRRFAELSITDRSLVFFDVHARVDGAGVVLTGRTNYPLIVEGLQKTLHAAGIAKVNSEVRSLPNRDQLGDEIFGVCRAPQALTFNKPGDSAGPQTQLLFGEPLYLLDRQDDYYLLLAGDGYWGWVARNAVLPMTEAQFDAYVGHARVALLDDFEYSTSDGTAGNIPRGAILPLAGNAEATPLPSREAPGEGQASADVRLLLPDGSVITAPAAMVRPLNPPPSTIAARINAALALLYTPYVFGGRSPVGLDCSGMITNVCARVGSAPSRDAWQQALAGRLSAVPWRRTDIHPGDQAFFIDDFGKVYHTGVAINPTHVVHASPPCVQISSLNRGDKLYDATLDRNFFMAKRP